MKKPIAALFLVASITAHATIIPLVVGITITAQIQNQNVVDANGIKTYGLPIAAKMTTATLLSQLATDEHNMTNYPWTTFPTGARLVMLYNDTNVNSSTFIVTDSTGFKLLDITNTIISFSITGDNYIGSGKQNDTTKLWTPQIGRYGGTIYFDDTGLGGPSQFFLTGLFIDTETQTLLTSLTYKDSESLYLKSGFGEGYQSGQQMVLTGTITAVGSKSPIFFP